jgi:ABC-type lipoprotein release transport system permease subunit
MQTTDDTVRSELDRTNVPGGRGMNPLSVWTFTLRHKGRAALLLGLISMATIGLYLAVALSWGIFIEPIRSNSMFLSRFSIVWPTREGLDPAVVARIRANHDVEQVLPTVLIQIGLPHVLGGDSDWFHLIGVDEADLPAIMERCGAALKEGELVRPNTDGILLSEEVAANLGLEVGDTIQNSMDRELYGNILDPLQVAGILESDVKLGIISLEYVESHEMYSRRAPHALVMARPGREAAVDAFLLAEIEPAGNHVETLGTLSERLAAEYRSSLTLLLPSIALIAAAITLVVGAVNRIAFSRRLPEFGILNAAGYSRRWLTRRLTRETAVMAVVGWLIGIGVSWLALYAIKTALFDPRGHDLTVVSLGPAAPVLLVPLSVMAFTLFTVHRALSRLDAVAVVERGELNPEEKQWRGASRSGSSVRPLASPTFFRRHSGRAALLAGTMALMIVAVVLLIFLLAATYDARGGSLGYLSRMSRVFPETNSSDWPAVIAQVRTHPAVERVIPLAPRWWMLDVLIPPFGGHINASPLSVYADDMGYLVDLFELELLEGHLPRPYTNEMVIPQILAQNRGLQVGDVVGNRDHPAYPDAPPLPAEFVISGVFARSSSPEDENWLGFVSLEFIESHGGFTVGPGAQYSFLVVPKTGQKEALDNWLEHELPGDGAWVSTYQFETERVEEQARSLILTVALLESLIAAVAAAALAVLNYISISQRQAEFGVLHALGHGRPRLVWRTVQETLLTTGAAWGASALLFLGGLAALQLWVFTPVGLELNPFSAVPWLSTLPIPAAVLFATAGTTARTLSKLDPVSIIERR